MIDLFAFLIKVYPVSLSWIMKYTYIWIVKLFIGSGTIGDSQLYFRDFDFIFQKWQVNHWIILIFLYFDRYFQMCSD